MRTAALDIVEKLTAAGHVAYFAGGCVRDQLREEMPTDYDIATDAPPEVVQRLFRRSSAVGAAFGVVLVYHGHGPHRTATEVATFRIDGAYRDGRRPDAVTFTDAKHDALRRDFTINGLFQDPLHPRKTQPASPETPTDADGVIDFVGGRADLEAGIIRAIGDPAQRFAEDYLRMLRAVRFAARFGFVIEPATAEAIRHHAEKLSDIARERIGDEVRRTLTGPRPGHAAQLWSDLGLDSAIFGGAAQCPDADELHKLDPAADYPTRLLAWIEGREPVVPPAAVRDRLALSNDEFTAYQQTASLCGQHENLPSDTVADRKRVFSHPRWPQALLRLRATAPGKHVAWIDDQMHRLTHDGIGLAPPPLLDGHALIAAGVKPGPAFKQLLDTVYDAQLQGEVTTPAQALAFALRSTP